MTEPRARSPAEIEIDDIRAAVRARVKDDGPPLTVAEIIVMLGGHSHTLIILVFCVLNMLPGPPGYGGTIAIVVFFIALAMVRGKQVRLPSIIGKRKVSSRLLLGMLKRLAWLASWLARFTAPRLTALTDERATMALGILIMILCVPMVVPIPLMNAIPNVGLTIICLARLNRDGFGMLLGIAVGIIGVLVDLWVIATVVSLAFAAGGFFRQDQG
jgi:hypothetical protein